MFIIDSNHRLIAAEAEDLARWGVQDIYEAAQAFGRDSLRLDLGRSVLSLPSGEELACDIETMESLLGSWSLCQIAGVEHSLPSEAETENPEAKAKEEDLLSTLLLPEEESTSKAKKEEPSTLSELASAEEEEELHLLPLEEPSEESSISQDLSSTATPSEEESNESASEDLLPLMPLEEESQEHPATTESIDEVSEISSDTEEEDLELVLGEKEPEASESKEILSLMPLEESEEQPATAESEEAPEAAEAGSAEKGEELEAVSEVEELEELLPLLEESEEESASPAETIGEKPIEAAWEKIASEFHPDLHANAKKIALDYEDYAELVREFVTDSRGMQERLLSSNLQERKDAASVLKDAVVLLYLQPLDKLLEMLDHASDEERDSIVETYNRLLERLDAMIASEEAGPAEEKSDMAPTPTPEIISETQAEATHAEPEIKEEKEAPTPTAEQKAPEGVAQVDIEEFLKGVKPVPIEFSLQLAANELNLPEDLVLEFIEDFDKQGHEYLPVLIEAYESKDLTHLQETAHMLKGAASNLRIEAMVDNLYDLQFDTDIERAPQRIRLFAGQLMSLDKYLEQMNRK